MNTDNTSSSGGVVGAVHTGLLSLLRSHSTHDGTSTRSSDTGVAPIQTGRNRPAETTDTATSHNTGISASASLGNERVTLGDATIDSDYHKTSDAGRILVSSDSFGPSTVLTSASINRSSFGDSTSTYYTGMTEILAEEISLGNASNRRWFNIEHMYKRKTKYTKYYKRTPPPTRTSAYRLSFSEYCDYEAYYCLRAHDTGKLCASTNYKLYHNFPSYCMLNYVNCMERYEVWQVVHMGACFSLPAPLPVYYHAQKDNDYWLDKQYEIDDYRPLYAV